MPWVKIDYRLRMGDLKRPEHEATSFALLAS